MRAYDGAAWAWRGINPDGTPDEGTLARLNSAIVEAVQPVRIVLFGSATRGEMRANTDVDVLVILPDGQNRRCVAGTIYRAKASMHASSRPCRRHRERCRAAPDSRWYVNRVGVARRTGPL